MYPHKVLPALSSLYPHTPLSKPLFWLSSSVGCTSPWTSHNWNQTTGLASFAKPLREVPRCWRVYPRYILSTAVWHCLVWMCHSWVVLLMGIWAGSLFGQLWIKLLWTFLHCIGLLWKLNEIICYKKVFNAEFLLRAGAQKIFPLDFLFVCKKEKKIQTLHTLFTRK